MFSHLLPAQAAGAFLYTSAPISGLSETPKSAKADVGGSRCGTALTRRRALDGLN
jgi:hypothetical protein